MEIDLKPSTTWSCLNCTVSNTTEYPSFILRQNDPDDKELEATLLTPEKIAELEAAFPVLYRVYAKPKTLICRHCHTVFCVYEDDPTPEAPIVPEIPEPAPSVAPDPVPEPTPTVSPSPSPAL